MVHARQLGVLAGPENDYFARALDALDVPLDRAHRPELLARPRSGFIELMDGARRSGDYPRCLAVLLVAEWLYLDWATRPDATPPDEPLQRGVDRAAPRARRSRRWVDFLRSRVRPRHRRGTPEHTHRERVQPD